MIKHLIGAAAVALVAVVGLVAAPDARPQAQGHVHAQATAPAAGKVTPMKPHTGPLPALPRISFEPPRPMAVVQQVYEFAARHPEVLQHVPCYCGCERIGHNGNHDCFIKSPRRERPGVGVGRARHRLHDLHRRGARRDDALQHRGNADRYSRGDRHASTGHAFRPPLRRPGPAASRPFVAGRIERPFLASGKATSRR